MSAVRLHGPTKSMPDRGWSGCPGPMCSKLPTHIALPAAEHAELLERVARESWAGGFSPEAAVQLAVEGA